MAELDNVMAHAELRLRASSRFHSACGLITHPAEREDLRRIVTYIADRNSAAARQSADSDRRLGAAAGQAIA